MAEEVQPDRRQCVSRTGRWLPPKANGWNVIEEEGQWYQYQPTGTTSYNVPAGHTRPPNTFPYKEYSFYHNRGIIRYTTFDATTGQVGDGRHSDDEDEPETQGPDDSDDDDSDDEQWRNWMELRFRWETHPTTGVQYSSATVGGNFQRLRLQHPDQNAWVNQLLPDGYHSIARVPRTAQSPPGSWSGAMTGEIPIMLALFAFSVNRNHLNAMVLQCIQEPRWRNHGQQRGEGCKLIVVHSPTELTPL
ncbi:hypothetical protein M8818_003841 [Zalaria obscura]|uniref:Uncharacterized protein n=1 Tax=Zalaria obscura TaxID=2024903 RepID=A0ACC3SE32_9PEZI